MTCQPGAWLACVLGRVLATALVGQTLQYAVQQAGQCVLLLAAEHVEHEAANRLHMVRRRRLDRSPACLRQSDHRAAGVGLALLADHKSALLHPADLVRQPAALPADRAAEIPSSQHTAL